MDEISTIKCNTNTSLIAGNGPISSCGLCGDEIFEQIVFSIGDLQWHAKCLICCQCGSLLRDKCFFKANSLYCKEDFFRVFGNKCASCKKGIAPTEIVRRANDYVYHLGCFECLMCHTQLETGDEFFLLDNQKLVCKTDYHAAKQKEMEEQSHSNKRPRTTINNKQLDVLREAYSKSAKPARHIREDLSKKTDLDMRVVQVWFQNRRAKEKRLKKDAGRRSIGASQSYYQSVHSNSNVQGTKRSQRSKQPIKAEKLNNRKSTFNHNSNFPYLTDDDFEEKMCARSNPYLTPDGGFIKPYLPLSSGLLSPSHHEQFAIAAARLPPPCGDGTGAGNTTQSSSLPGHPFLQINSPSGQEGQTLLPYSYSTTGFPTQPASELLASFEHQHYPGAHVPPFSEGSLTLHSVLTGARMQSGLNHSGLAGSTPDSMPYDYTYPSASLLPPASVNSNIPHMLWG